MERKMMDCCIGCRNYQRCMVCRFESDVVCIKWKLSWAVYRLKRLFGGG